jgi:2-polyprenyl-3-methyl-5-hydroxy-6-metoxy-1,4-benzoquinol methylase
MAATKAKCWCGAESTRQFSEHYLQCPSCHTLISDQIKPAGFYKGADDGDALYGRDYWLHHVKKLGYPDIYERARNDLIERDIYWLRDILKYRLPPGKTLELGCCHGGSVHLMRLAGFDASGAEMSPWLCQFAGDTFMVPMLCGPIEDLDVESGSLDVLVMMDVLEHMPDPVGSMKRIAGLLKDDGMAVIQTPCFRGYQRSYDQIEAANEMFLAHMKENEHLYLYNEDSLTRLLHQTGFPHIAFEKPIFAYDMFLFAGKKKLIMNDDEAIAANLTGSADGRTVLALLDLYNLLHEQRANRAEAARYQRHIQQIYYSWSWRLTAPLRWLFERLPLGKDHQ